nr:polysaccharide biosynthesis/export family protein [Thiolinea sp.]
TEYRADWEKMLWISVNSYITIKVFQADELSGELRVDPQGNISMPLIGTILVKGLDQFQLEKKLAAQLGEKYLQDPQVTVTVKEATTQRVTVEGEVNKAGVFPIQGDISVLQAVALAGGLSNLADPTKTVLFRKQGSSMKAYHVDLDQIRKGQTRDPYIRNDDRIIIARSGSRYWLREIGSIVTPYRFLTQ